MGELALAPAAAAAVAAGLGVELRLFAPSRAPRRGEAILWSTGWLLLALAVAAGIALTGGPAGEWTTVYLIERSLSLDNVFLFSLLLAYFFVPPELRGRVIVIGIAGAILLRGVAILAGVALIESVEAVVYAFGVLLLYVAYRAFRGAAEEADPTGSPALRLFRRVVPTTADFRGRRLFVREEGRLRGTPLLLVVVAIIVADIAFAVDSIPAALAVTRDPVVIWTANAFAFLGSALCSPWSTSSCAGSATWVRRSRSFSPSSGSRSSPTTSCRSAISARSPSSAACWGEAPSPHWSQIGSTHLIRPKRRPGVRRGAPQP
jgi:tellurite resistance protein TerC